MTIQKTISYFLNDETREYCGCNKKTLRALKAKLSSMSGQSGLSIRDYYRSIYGKDIRRKTVRKELKILKQSKESEMPVSIRDFIVWARKNFNKNEVKAVLLSGSLGDGGFINGYSDFDAVVVLKKEAVEYESILATKKKIVKANSFLYLFDPLQHHNLFVFSEFDLENYFESAFPLALYDDALEVTGYSNSLVFNTLETDREIIKSFNYWDKVFSDPRKHNLHKKRVYNIKHLTQCILFLPLAYYQMKTKKYISKKEVYKTVKYDFSKKTWEVIEKCTLIRNKYRFQSWYPYFFRKFIGLTLGYRKLRELHRYFDRNNKDKILSLSGDNLLSEGKMLFCEMKKNLEKENV